MNTARLSKHHDSNSLKFRIKEGYQNEVHEILGRIDKSLNAILRGPLKKAETKQEALEWAEARRKAAAMESAKARTKIREEQYIESMRSWRENAIRLNEMAAQPQSFSETDMYNLIDKWLEGMSKQDKSKACQYMYDTISPENPKYSGRETIEDYCKRRGIRLIKF
jgi:hypothetical protein